MNSYDLSGQVAIVTGGAQGIGFAVAERLYQSGAFVELWDLDRKLASEAASRLGQRASAAELNVSEWAAVERLVATTLAKHNRLDILVANAGIAGSNAPLKDYPVDEWYRIIETNLHGVFHCCRAVLPAMSARGYGRIVNIASIAGKEGNPNAAAYSASKAGVIALTKSLGKEHAAQNIAVNCVTPAAARTRIFDQMSQEHIAFMLSKIPRGRFLELNEAAEMICWLCTPENSFTTGGVFDLSGGRATY